MRKPNVQLLVFVFVLLTISLAIPIINSWVHSLVAVNGLINKEGGYVGRDFIYFYTAAKEAVSGHIHNLYNNGWAQIPAIEGTDTVKSVWQYPPHYLLLLSWLPALPYYYSFAAWTCFSLVLVIVALWYVWQVRGFLFIVAILNINLLVCLVMGQNTLIFAALAGAGIAALKRYAFLAGSCFAVLSMKPHFALLIPLVLIFSKQWEALVYTIGATLFLMLASSLLFGFDIWLMALNHFQAVSNISVSNNISYFSIYSTQFALFELGVLEYYRWVGQFLVASAAFYFFQKIWRGNYSLESKWLGFAIAAVLFTPYNLAYDTVFISLPALVMTDRIIKGNVKLPIIFSILLVLQIFAFAIISINHHVAMLLIISALALLWLISERMYDKAS